MANKTKTIQPNTKLFFDYLDSLVTEKNLSREQIHETLKTSFLAAYHREYGYDANIEVEIDQEAGEFRIVRTRKVVEKVKSNISEISVEDGKGLPVGDVVREYEDPLNFTRVGIHNVRQILHQRLQELERQVIYDEFKDKVGEMINGYFLRWRGRDLVYVDLGKTEGLLPRREQMPNDRFRSGDRIKAIIKKIELRREKSRDVGPFITLSRASPDFVRRLFEIEIPEIYDSTVEILKICRHPGYRTKIMVRSTKPDIDPVGACVGVKGVRIQSIVRELGSERIDIINADSPLEQLISEALSPAKVIEVRIDRQNKEALVIVMDDSHSLAIGMSGQNVRLASQLTGYHLIVRSETQFNQEISSPVARAKLDQLFQKKEDVSTPEQTGTPLNELTDLSKRIIGILNNDGINTIEELLEKAAEDLAEIDGIGKTTAHQIKKILKDSVEFEEE